MAKIETFNMRELLDIEEKYCDMFIEVEQRAREIALDLGKIDNTYITNNAETGNFDGKSIQVYAMFVQMGVAEENEDPKTVQITFPIEWLFSDDYKTQYNVEELKRQREEEREYQEYLRLKRKFEKI